MADDPFIEGRMTRIRSRWCLACAAVGLLVSPQPLRAQSFGEFGGGWNYVGPGPDGATNTNGFNIRASIGRVVTPRVRLRFDVFVSDFDRKVQFYPPCPAPGCAHPYYNTESAGIAGLTANGIVNADSRGIFYVTGGAGLYDSYGRRTEIRPGISAGVGVAVPVGTRLRAVVEARWHGLIGTTAGPSWIVPITVGFRY